MSRVALFINGQPPSRIPNLNQFEQIYCTDGIYYFLKENEIIPDVITGDFDSADVNDFPEGVEILETPNQDYTDFEKALQIIEKRNFYEVYIYGASGKEQDHFLGNLSAGLKFKDRMTLMFFDDYGYYFFAEKETVLDEYKGRKVSLYPFPEAKGITTIGLEYPLVNEDLSITGRIGIRNRAVEDEVKIIFEEGNLLVFILN